MQLKCNWNRMAEWAASLLVFFACPCRSVGPCNIYGALTSDWGRISGSIDGARNVALPRSNHWSAMLVKLKCLPDIEAHQSVGCIAFALALRTLFASLTPSMSALPMDCRSAKSQQCWLSTPVRSLISSLLNISPALYNLLKRFETNVTSDEYLLRGLHYSMTL